MSILTRSHTPLRLHGNATMQCRWTSEFKYVDYPELGLTFIRFWWKDIRYKTFVEVCSVKLELTKNDVVTCEEVQSRKHFPKFAKTGRPVDPKQDFQIIEISDIVYASEMRCSFSIFGDEPTYSETIKLDVRGKLSIANT